MSRDGAAGPRAPSLRWSPDVALLAAAGGLGGLALLALALPIPGGVLPAAAAALLVATASDAWLSRREPIVSAERRLPERAHRGRAAEVTLRLANPAPRAVRVELYEAVPEGLGASRQHFRARLPAGGTRELPYTLRPERRGDVAFGAVVLFVGSRLGLLRRRVLTDAGQELRVYPDPGALLRREALDPRRLFAELGVRPVRRRGDGFEFESLRDYVPGDDPRRLDWAASARRGRAVVRCYEHERNHTVCIALDASRLMAAEVAGRSKLDHAVDAALVLAHAALTSGDRVSLCAFDREVRGFLAPRRHRGELGAVLDFLRPLAPRRVEADYRALVRVLATRQRQRALVVVLTDFVEVDATALRESLAVLARRHPVLLVAIRDPLFAALDPRAPLPPGGALEVHRRLVLGDLLLEREVALHELRRLGPDTLDLAPAQLTTRVLNRYLAARYGPGR